MKVNKNSSAMTDVSSTETSLVVARCSHINKFAKSILDGSQSKAIEFISTNVSWSVKSEIASRYAPVMIDDICFTCTMLIGDSR